MFFGLVCFFVFFAIVSLKSVLIFSPFCLLPHHEVSTETSLGVHSTLLWLLLLLSLSWSFFIFGIQPSLMLLKNKNMFGAPTRRTHKIYFWNTTFRGVVGKKKNVRGTHRTNTQTHTHAFVYNGSLRCWRKCLYHGN